MLAPAGRAWEWRVHPTARPPKGHHSAERNWVSTRAPPISTDIAPLTVACRRATPNPKHLLARSTPGTHRQILAARATPSNDNVHSPVRDSGCHQEARAGDLV